jgi:hypothetical protein
MTIQEMLKEIRTLSINERKELINAIVDTLTETHEPQSIERIPGLHAGTTWVSDDFDDPLPDSFWFGDE